MFKNKKKNKEQELGTSFERLRTYTFVDYKTIDEQMIDLGDTLISGRAVVANFEELHNIAEVNRVVAFLSGICYATEGIVKNIGNETFIFATKQALVDGTIEHSIDDVAKDTLRNDE